MEANLDLDRGNTKDFNAEWKLRVRRINENWRYFQRRTWIYEEALNNATDGRQNYMDGLQRHARYWIIGLKQLFKCLSILIS